MVQPFWIRLHREVVKEDGPYAGEVTLPTAVNFWLEEDANIFKSVMDLRRRYYQNDDIFKKHPITELGLQCLADKKRPFPSSDLGAQCGCTVQSKSFY